MIKPISITVAALLGLTILVLGCFKLFSVGMMMFMVADSALSVLGLAVMCASVCLCGLAFTTVAIEILKQFSADI
jgi:membrane-bound ClpP family serine protease